MTTLDKAQERDEASSKIAHDLRNPLGSALMALTLLRLRVTSVDDIRLLDTLERNLKRVERIIDEQLAPSLAPTPDRGASV